MANQPNAIYAVRKGIPSKIIDQARWTRGGLCLTGPGELSASRHFVLAGGYPHEANPDNSRRTGEARRLSFLNSAQPSHPRRLTDGRRTSAAQQRPLLLLLLKAGDEQEQQACEHFAPRTALLAPPRPGRAGESSTTIPPTSVVAESSTQALKWPEKAAGSGCAGARQKEG